MPRRSSLLRHAAGLSAFWLASTSLIAASGRTEARAQEVGLPAPRLLTIMPMGGQAGTSLEVAVTGESIDNADELLFSSPKITAKPKLAADGQAVPNQFVVTIDADAPRGVHEARVMTRLGISASRAFSVGSLPDVMRDKPNTSPQTAMQLAAGSVCNASTSSKAVDYYTFHAARGVHLAIDCVAAGIDSKLTPVLIVGDSAGHDLLVDRRGGVLDFTAGADGDYFLKVHDLTYQGGERYFYRLALRELGPGEKAARQPRTIDVGAGSWAADSPSSQPEIAEVEPNDKPAEAQKITLPARIAGSFYPAADVDNFEFEGKQGEVWWVEVASERLGLPTDPFVLVQRVTRERDVEKLEDVAEMSDIPAPIKPSSGGTNSYDGPPYDAGSADVLGKLEIKQDGLYRLQLRDLFGGTRSDPANIYKLIIRKAAPDFAVVAWAFHAETRNADRNALSKPIALRGGGSMALEVAAIRRDGFNGDIELGVDDLPEGVTATGLKIAPGKNRGIIVITAAEKAPRSHKVARLFGRAQIDGAAVSHPCPMASVVWVVRDVMFETPFPRLLADTVVSVSGLENAPITIAPQEDKVFEAKAGEKLTIPLAIVWRGEFTAGPKLRTFGAGFEAAKEIEITNKAPTADAVLDLAALKTPPGEYVIAFYGPGAINYRNNPGAIDAAAEALKQAEQAASAAAAEAKRLADEAKAAGADQKAAADAAAKAAAETQRQAEAAKSAAAGRLKTATDAAKPTITSDIIVSQPIRLLIKPADAK